MMQPTPMWGLVFPLTRAGNLANISPRSEA